MVLFRLVQVVTGDQKLGRLGDGQRDCLCGRLLRILRQRCRLRQQNSQHGDPETRPNPSRLQTFNPSLPKPQFVQWPAKTVPSAEPVPSLSDHTAPKFCAAGPKKAPLIFPTADPDKLIGWPGADAAAVVPLNVFEPVAIFAVTETSFQCSVLVTIIWVKLPLTAPDPKFAEIEALPTMGFEA